MRISRINNEQNSISGGKHFVIFFLVGLFLTQTLIKTITLIHWKINQNRITELYCINKNNPMMHCEGKCFLSHQLQKIENDYQESKQPFHLKYIKEVEFLIYMERLQLSYDFLFLIHPTSFMGGIYEDINLFHIVNAVFHPPRCFNEHSTY